MTGRRNSLASHGDLLGIYCECPVEVCERRDVKGMRKRTRFGEIKDYTEFSLLAKLPSLRTS